MTVSQTDITFKPVVRECVVVMRGSKVIGTIRRYRAFKRVIVSVPGILSASENPGKANFATFAEAKLAILAKDTSI